MEWVVPRIGGPVLPLRPSLLLLLRVWTLLCLLQLSRLLMTHVGLSLAAVVVVAAVCVVVAAAYVVVVVVVYVVVVFAARAPREWLRVHHVFEWCSRWCMS